MYIISDSFGRVGLLLGTEAPVMTPNGVDLHCTLRAGSELLLSHNPSRSRHRVYSKRRKHFFLSWPSRWPLKTRNLIWSTRPTFYVLLAAQGYYATSCCSVHLPHPHPHQACLSKLLKSSSLEGRVGVGVGHAQSSCLT